MQSHPDMNLRPAVPSIPVFKNVLENGQVVQSVAPMPATKSDQVKHYHSSVSHTSFFRQDGKRLPFISHHFETDLYWDQIYLDGEIDAGNSYVRHATEDEIEVAHMAIDPKGTITKKVMEALADDPAFRASVQEQLLAEMVSKGTITQEAADAMRAEGKPVSDEQKLGGVDNGHSGNGKTEHVGGARVSLLNGNGKGDAGNTPFRAVLGGIQNSTGVKDNTVQSGT